MPQCAARRCDAPPGNGARTFEPVSACKRLNNELQLDQTHIAQLSSLALDKPAGSQTCGAAALAPATEYICCLSSADTLPPHTTMTTCLPPRRSAIL